MKTFIVLLAIFAVAYSEQSIPIPPAVDGLLVGNANATFQIDAFIDLICSDCKADWPIMKSLYTDVAKYGVSVRFHILPLPFHTHAFLFATAANFFFTKASQADALKFLDFAFKVQNQFYNVVAVNLTANQVVALAVDLAAAEFTNYNRSQLLDAFTNMDYNAAARVSYKYAAHHGIGVTPSFTANGVLIDGAKGFAYNDWITFLQQFVSIPSAKELINEHKFKRHIKVTQRVY